MGGHHGGTDLAQPHAVAPAVTAEDDLVGRHLHVEPGTVQVAFGEDAADHEFLADGEGGLGTGVFWSTLPVERAVEEPVLRLVVAELLEELRLVRSFWLAVPVDRAVEEPVLRLVVAEPEVLRFV